MNLHDRRAKANARHFGFKGALIFASVVRHVGRRTTHIEANHLVEAREFRHRGRANNAAGWPGQDGVLALKLMRIGQAAGALHELQTHVADGRLYLLHVAPQNWR